MIMPMGDDEYDQFDQHNKPHHGMSKAEQRRSNKPIMEKRRRARINHCLNELKSLILDAMKKDPARHSKLEKADILEMTVKHLQTVQRQQLAVAVATDPSVLHKFKTGFNECAGEVSRYIGNLEGVEVGVKQRLVSHLANCVTGLQQLSPFAFGNTNVSVFPNVPQDLNNNQRVGSSQHLQGLQLIPSRLPTGELALLVPNSNNMPFFPGTATGPPGSVPTSTVTSGSGPMDRNHPSAFTAVNRPDLPNTSKSPPLSPTTSTSSDDTEPSDYQGSGSHVPLQQYQAQNHQRQMTSSFVGEGGSFKIPLRSPSGFKTFQPAEHKSPQQHSVVSSTCLPQDSATSHNTQSQGRCGSRDGATTYAQVKLEFKTVPIPRGVINASLPATAQQPLTVVTSQVYDIPTGNEQLQVKNPLDFSIRKDISFNNNRQCVSTQTPSVGGGKRQFPVHFESGSSSSELISSSMGSPNKIPRYSFSVAPSASGEAFYRGRGEYQEGGDRHAANNNNNNNINNRPSTSSAVAAAAAADAKENMWRPW